MMFSKTARVNLTMKLLIMIFLVGPLCSGILPRDEAPMVEVDLNAPEPKEHKSALVNDAKEEKSTISKL